jgi:hypothetical protein
VWPAPSRHGAEADLRTAHAFNLRPPPRPAR